MVAAGGVVILFLILASIFGGNDNAGSEDSVEDSDTIEKSEEATDSTGEDSSDSEENSSNEEEDASDNNSNENNDNENNAEEKKDSASDSSDESDSNEQSDNQESDENKDENENKEENNTQVEESDKENVEKVITKDWKPVATEQDTSGTHRINYDDANSQDWQELLAAIRKASGLSEGNMITWRVNGAGQQKAVGTVTNQDQTETYRVHVRWVENQGYQPTKMELLNKNPYKDDY
nr:YrrS family protein [Thalassobacillus sp. CUG 92003]